MIQFEIEIYGKVQGVGFRHFTVQKAREFGISGWVKNTIDGDILIVAQGDEAVLNTFVDFLSIGPTRARVDKISKHKTEVSTVFDSFSVKY